MYNFYICKLCKIQIYVECDRFFFTPLPDFVMIKMLGPDFETHPNIFIPVQYIRKQGEAKRIRPAESEATGRTREQGIINIPPPSGGSACRKTCRFFDKRLTPRRSALIVRRWRSIRTFAGREVFSPTYTPRSKMIDDSLPLAAANSARLF